MLLNILVEIEFRDCEKIHATLNVDIDMVLKIRGLQY